MNGQGRSKSANQNKDTGKQVEESDDFKKEPLPLQPWRSSTNIQRLLNDIVGAADCVDGVTLSEIIKGLSDVAVTFDFDTIDFQENIACLNPGKLCGAVANNYLSLYCSLTGLNP